MVAYSFNPRFVEPIRAGTKGGTIRAARKTNIPDFIRPGGHALPGERLQLYCRQRQGGGLIDQRPCIATGHILLCFGAPGTPEIIIGEPGAYQRIRSDAGLDVFARFDGFADFGELAAFWRKTHGAAVFDGWHIRWLPLPELG